MSWVVAPPASPPPGSSWQVVGRYPSRVLEELLLGVPRI